MDRLDAMELFVIVADLGSLAAAARRAACSPATVTRAIAALEASLGERLLHRTARRMQLTPAGENQLATYRTVLSELSESGLVGKPRDRSAGQILDGRLALTAPELFGRLHVLPVLDAFIAQHPAVRARALLINRVVNLVEEGIDLAVRLAPLADSGLVAIRVGTVRALVCASPTHLARAGAPATPADLAQHRCIGTDDAQERLLWRFARKPNLDGRSVGPTASMAVTPHLALNNAGAALDTALRDGGFCRSMSYQVGEHLAAGRLVTVLDAYEPPPIPVHLVFHPIPRRRVVLRRFIDTLAPQLKDSLAASAATMQAYAAMRRGD